MSVKAFEVFDTVSGSTVKLVSSEREAMAASVGSLDYEEVIRSRCYCDSAYHPLGH